MNNSYIVLLILFIIGPSGPMTAQDTEAPNTTIFIYDDKNNDGVKDPDEEYLSGFSLDVTGFDGHPIQFSESPGEPGIFKGYVPKRARVVVNGYSDDHLEGNVGSQSSASVFYAEPHGGDVSYYVGISSGPNLNYEKQNIVVPCYEGGPAEGRKGPALIEFGFMDDGVIEKLGGKAPNPRMLASIEEIGATWGLGMQPKANIVYTSALVKRHVGLGPMGIGGLYQYDFNQRKLSSLNLQNAATANGAGNLNFGSLNRNIVDREIAHNGSDNFSLTKKDMVATYDIDAFDKVGKAGIGDIDVTEDEKTLWMVNLYERSLVSMDVSNGQPDLGTIHSYPILGKSGLPKLDFQYIRNFNVGGQEPGGGEAFTDQNKVAWERDKYSNNGLPGNTKSTPVTNTNNPTEGTSIQNLYNSFRSGTYFTYNIPVPAGTYTVRLHFVETDVAFTSPVNKRTFTVKAEGNEKLVDFNIRAEKSFAEALVKELSVQVSDGTLNLEFIGQLVDGVQSQAVLSGIEVIGSEDNKVLSGELRPWGLAFHQGKGYLGLVSDASITKSKDHLFGYVVSFDPGNVDAGFQIELEFPLKYPRERSSFAHSNEARPLRTSMWEAWVDTWEETGIELQDDGDTMNLSYPQPIISDIDFDDQGHMIIGVMGRWAHQVGFMNYPPIPGKQIYLIGYASGDILKAVPSVMRADNNFVIELNNNDPGTFYSGTDGPSYDGEFFYEDYFDSPKAHHGEIFTGGLGVMPILNEVVLTVFNPIVTNGDNTNFEFNGVYTQGTHVYSTEDGSKKRASLFVDQYQFGKANGLGDIEFSFTLPNNNIGNYVWCDANGDGIQQANENGIPGVELILLSVDPEVGNQIVTTTTTDENGLYLFRDLDPQTNYIIKIDLNQPGLDGFQRKASPAFQGGNPRLDSDGLDDVIPGCVIAEVTNSGGQFNYSYDFGLLGPESSDVTRTACLDIGENTVVFNLCEIDSAVIDRESFPNLIVEYYESEEDAIQGTNPVSRTGECGYVSAGGVLIAKVSIPGDELCYSLSTVTLVVNEPGTNIELEALVCPEDNVDLGLLIDLNQDGLMVYTEESLDPGTMITEINSYYTGNTFPVTLYFKASFDDDCDVFGSIVLNTVPPFEVDLIDQATICEGELFYFNTLEVTFPMGGNAISDIYWSTNGNGTFNSSSKFSEARSYAPSDQDIQRGFIEFNLNASNYCYSEQRTVYVNIITNDHLRVECLPSDTVYCFDPRIEDPYDPDFPAPTAVLGCDQELLPILNFVDIDMDHCDSPGDVSSRIIRHWEFNYKDKFTAFCTDTIYVFSLPKLTPAAFIGTIEDTFYCELEAAHNDGEILKHYAAWKQPVGLHDYELPYTKLAGLTYEIPLTIIEAGLINAQAQGSVVYEKYLESVILRKGDGTEVTIKDIVSGAYMSDLIATATTTQKGFGFLQALIELNEEPVKIVLETLVFEYYPYLLLQPGDFILSEDGNFEKVDEEWFYNGNGNSPYWFAGGWPSIYGSGQCVSYCDAGAHNDFDCILIQIPSLNGGAGFDPENCDTICLTSIGDLCGITIERDLQEEWTGICTQTRGMNTKITQTCWSEMPNTCAEDLSADEVDLVTSYDTTKKVVIQLSQWQTLIDTLGPIFDFCYPIEWNQEEIQTSIHNGVIGSAAMEWERNNPTIYRVGLNSCDAEVFVPDVKVIDNCSDVHSVKAMVETKGRTRAIAMVRTATEIKIMDNGDTCYVHTYSHTFDPIIIPISGYDGKLYEVRYEAADECWNQSTWSKFVRVVDHTAPTVVADRALTFTLQDKVGWMNAIDIDEGSWDNCGEILILGRRVDWDKFYVNLCSDEIANVTTLEELNKIDPLSVLDSGQVELYYRNMIEWLGDDEACGDDVVEGWIQGLRAYWAENCGPKDDHGNPLIEVPPTLLGGGWSKKIPFGCEDACTDVMVEILVMDPWCNWSKSWATVYVEDGIPPKKLVTLDDITITCDAYSKYYKSVLDLAEQVGSSDQDPALFEHLDNLLGGYTISWANNKGQPVDMNGTVLPEDFNVLNTFCEDTLKELRYQDTVHDNEIVWKTRNIPVTYLSDLSEKYKRGYIGVNCHGSIKQDIWPDLDDCGVGTIMRKFHVTTGCGEKEVTETYVQTIYIQPTCELRAEMFEWPNDTQACLAFTQDSRGNVNIPLQIAGKAEYTFPAGCRMMAIGYTDQVLNMSSTQKIYKVLREYSAMDWCTGETIKHLQTIIISDTCSSPDNGTLTLAGTILDPNNNYIRNVTLRTENQREVQSTYKINDGTYFMNVPNNLDLVYLNKETPYGNGVSTLDLILIQRYLKDPSVFVNPYQVIAADVNNNGLVEASDLMEIRNLILGKQNSFTYVQPWQFVDKTSLKAYSKVAASDLYLENNWIGVKMGDVNFDSDYLIRTTNRSRKEMYPVYLEEERSKEGNKIIHVTMSESIHLSGFQLFLDLKSHRNWKLTNGKVKLTDNQWSSNNRTLSISWNEGVNDRYFEKGAILFTIKLDDKQITDASEKIRLNPLFDSEVYTSDLEVKTIGLRYIHPSEGFTHTVFPNPAEHFQKFEFNSPKAMDAMLSIKSIDGKDVEMIKLSLQAGKTTYDHILSDRYNSGIYVYQIRTEEKVATGRFEVIR